MSQPTLRLDKWLWQARFFKSRTLAGRFCAAGRVRVRPMGERWSATLNR